MKNAIWVLLLGAVVGGGYYGWTAYGEGAMRTYRVEHLMKKSCNKLRVDVKSGNDPTEAAENVVAALIAEAKDMHEIALAEEGTIFEMDDAGKRCSATVVEANGNVIDKVFSYK